MSTALGDFLRARRARLTREDVGLPDDGQRRRVPGLRREEVAALAHISTDYYTRLEQGRMRASAPVVASLAAALGLDDDATDYLHEVAGLAAPGRVGEAAPDVDPTEVEPLQALVDDLRLSPAFVVGPRTEILAWNGLAAAMITDFGAIPVEQRYYIRLLVTDPAMRHLYDDWPEVTHLAVEQMRHLAAGSPDDPCLVRLVRELSALDADFARWWDSHDVASRTAGMKVLHHPVVGELHLDWNALTWNANPQWQVIVWSAPPRSPSRRRLELLDAHWRCGTAARTPPHDDPGRPA